MTKMENKTEMIEEWRNLNQRELAEHMKMPEKTFKDTSMRNYDPDLSFVLRHVRFRLFDGKLIGHNVIWSGNVHRGAAIMFHRLETEMERLEELNMKLSAHLEKSIRDEVEVKTRWIMFPSSKKVDLKLEQWVFIGKAYVSECLSMESIGLYCLALCYSLREEEEISMNDRKVLDFHIEKFEGKINSRIKYLGILAAHGHADDKNGGIM